MAVQIGQLATFTSGLRKKYMLAWNWGIMMNDLLSWIASVDQGIVMQQVMMSGTVDGVNAVFTIPTPFANTAQIFKNGIDQVQGIHYNISGQTVTFIAPFIPQPASPIYPGDTLTAWIS